MTAIKLDLNVVVSLDPKTLEIFAAILNAGSGTATKLPPIAPNDNPATGNEAPPAPPAPAPAASLDPASIFGQGAAAAAAAAAAATHVETDSAGLPWDARIHAGTKTKNANGSWKSKRGVDDVLVAQVEAELRQAMSIPFVPLSQGAAPSPAAPPPPSPSPAAPPPPAPAPSPAAASEPSSTDAFVQLCQFVTGNALPAARITEVCKRYGLPGLGLAASRKDLIPLMMTDFTTGV